MKKLILPKPHISWSAMYCWESSPARFRREYFEAGRKLDTKYFRFGKTFANTMEELANDETLLENAVWVKDKFGLYIDSPEFAEFKEGLIWYDVPELEIRTTVLGVPILSYLDSSSSEHPNFREYKTGKIPWTKAKVIKHGQLKFYAVALKWSTGVTPEYCDLDWMETKESTEEVEDFWRQNEKKIVFTGKIKSFHHEFSEAEIESMEKRIVKAAKEISVAYQEFINEI